MGTPNNPIVETLRQMVMQLPEEDAVHEEIKAREAEVLQLVLELLRPVLKYITGPQKFLNLNHDDVELYVIWCGQRTLTEPEERTGKKFRPGYYDLYLGRDGKFLISWPSSSYCYAIEVVFEQLEQLLDWTDLFSVQSIVGYMVEGIGGVIARREHYLDSLRRRRDVLEGMLAGAKAKAKEEGAR